MENTVKITFTNGSTNEIKLVKENVGTQPIYLNIINMATKQKVKYSGPICKASHEFITIKPNEAKTYEIDLSGYDFPGPGEYSITPFYTDPLGKNHFMMTPFNYKKS